MILINPNPEPFIPHIPFVVKPEEKETLYSWLARKNHQREYYAEIERKET